MLSSHHEGRQGDAKVHSNHDVYAGLAARFAELLADMNNLVKLPQLGATMRVMAREMEKVAHDSSVL